MRSHIVFSMVCGLAAGSLNITTATFLTPTAVEKWVVPDGKWTPYVGVPIPVTDAALLTTTTVGKWVVSNGTWTPYTGAPTPTTDATLLIPTTVAKWVVPDGTWTPYVEAPTPVQSPVWTPAPSVTPTENIGRSSNGWIVWAVVGCLVGLLVLVFFGFLIRALVRWKKTGVRPSLLTFGCLPQRDERYMMNQV